MLASTGRFLGASKIPLPPSTDPNYSSNALLLHFEGANNSTIALDNSPNGFASSVGGAAKISTANSKFGTSSAQLTAASADGFLFASSALFNCGQSNYTIEGWFRPSSVSGGAQQTLWRFNGGVAQNPYLMIIDNTMYLRGTNAGSDLVGSFVHGMAINTWYHIAVVKSGTTWTVFIEGVQKATGTSSAVTSENKSFSIGGGGTVGSMAGYFDDIRLTAGVSRYTSNFTPAGPFSNY